MEVLSLGALDKLRKFVRLDSDFLKVTTASFDDLVSDLELVVMDLPIPALDGKLAQLDGSMIDESDIAATDSELAPYLFDSMSLLSPAHATDERIWTTLSLNQFSSYTRKRWQKIPVDEGKARTWIEAHWLCGSANRSRSRDNAIARLWWTGKIAHSIEGWSPSEVASELFINTDFRAAVVERPTATTAMGVAKSILELSREYRANDVMIKRVDYRAIMKEVSFVAARANVAALTAGQLIELFRPIFERVLVPEKSKGLLGKIFGVK